MVAYYDRVSPCRIRRNTVIYGQKNDRLLPSYTEVVYDLRFPPFFFVYDRIVPYTVTEIYDRNTRPCNTVKYGRIRKNMERTRSFTGVKDSVFGDLGLHYKATRIFSQKKHLEPDENIDEIHTLITAF